MKRFSEQFYKESKSVKLTRFERDELKERLVSYMEYHPLPVEQKLAQRSSVRGVQSIKAEAFTLVRIPFGLLSKVTAGMVAVVFVVVPFLAERAVPGDVLYAVKVEFNEELRSTLTFNTYERVDWETERLNRRIAEARLLASEGRLTEEAEAAVAEAVREHSENARRGIEEIRSVDTDEAMIASIALDTTLEVQSTVFKESSEVAMTLAETTGAPAPRSSLLAEAIQESKSNNQGISSTTVPSYEKLMARVEQNTTRIYELRNSIAELVPAQTVGEIDRRVTDLERSINEAILLAGEEDTQLTARQQLVQILQRSQRLIVFMTELEVSATVDINDLVPVILTPEEEVMKVTDWNDEITQKRAMLARVVTADEASDVSVELREKYRSIIEEVDGLVADIASSTDFTEQSVKATEALLLLNNALIALEAQGIFIPAVSISTVFSTSSATTSTESIEDEEAESDETIGSDTNDEEGQTISPATSSRTTVVDTEV